MEVRGGERNKQIETRQRTRKNMVASSRIFGCSIFSAGEMVMGVKKDTFAEVPQEN